jgi:hypothetical protein
VTIANVLGVGRKGAVLECARCPQALLGRHADVLLYVPGASFVVVAGLVYNSIHEQFLPFEI